MSRKSAYPVETKFSDINDYLGGNKGTNQICHELNISKETFRRWRLKYESQGEQAPKAITHNKYYPQELKVQEIEDYLAGSCSLEDIIAKFKISNVVVVIQWLRKYNGHELMKYRDFTGRGNYGAL